MMAVVAFMAGDVEVGFSRPPIQSMNISLPETLKEFVNGQLAAGR
jgi:hypothetical protein